MMPDKCQESLDKIGEQVDQLINKGTPPFAARMNKKTFDYFEAGLKKSGFTGMAGGFDMLPKKKSQAKGHVWSTPIHIDDTLPDGAIEIDSAKAPDDQEDPGWVNLP